MDVMEATFLQSFLTTLEQWPAWFRVAFVALCLCVAWSLERGFPRFNLAYRNWWQHARTNLALLLSMIVIGLIFASLVVGLIA